MRRALRIALLALAFAFGTHAIGWSAVPVIGFVWGAIADRERAPVDALLATVLAWSALLSLAAVAGRAGDVARVIASVIGVPSWVPVAITLVFGSVLAWSSGVVGREIARVVRSARHARTSSAREIAPP